MADIVHLQDSDDDIPAPSKLNYRNGVCGSANRMNDVANSPVISSALTAASTPALASTRIQKRTYTTATGISEEIASTPQQKKKTKATKAFCLIWVCTHGKGRRSNWRKKDLKIVGVYPSKSHAEEAKRKVMSEHECCGHGDISVGGCWDDEIDLVIREAPMTF